MTPPAAATAPRTRTRTTTRKPPPRRVSGPARGRGTAAAAATAPPPLALRLGGAVHGLAEHRFLDRIIGGRAWIAILAVGLMGIVFMQVSMLQMNAGIGASVERASVLERENSAMRAMISELSSGERIAAEAAQLGLVLPPGTPRFLEARGADADKAVASMTLPGEGIVPSPHAAEAQTLAASTVPTIDQTGVVPEAGTTPAPETATTTETAVTPATTTTADPGTATTATDPAATTTTTTAPAAPEPTSTEPTTATATSPTADTTTGGAGAPTG